MLLANQAQPLRKESCMFTPPTSKFISCQAATRWQLGNSNVFSTGDIDGDGRQEVIVFSNDIDNLSLSVNSYFRYGELSPNWASDPQYLMITNWMTGAQMPGGAWTFDYGDQFLCADLDGDGQDEIAALKLGNSNITHYPCYLGVFKWQLDPQSGYQTLAVQNTTICSTPTSGPTAYFYFSNIYVGDIDGDGVAEIVGYGMESIPQYGPIIAVYKWVNGSLQLLSYSSTTGGSSTWNVGWTDQLYCADLDGDGQVEILIFNPGQNNPRRIGVLKWNSSSNQLDALWIASGTISNGGWNLSAQDQFYSADLDGDGIDEIIGFKPQTDTEKFPCYIGVFKWNSSSVELELVWVKSGDISNGWWNFSTIDQFYFGDINGDKADEIICYKPQSDTPQYPCYIGVFKWNSSSSELEVVWTASGDISNGWWNFSTTDTFFCADIDGDQKAEVMAFKQGDPCNNYHQYPCYLGIFGWDGSALEVLGESVNFIAAWAIDLFNGIPSAGLTAFTTQGQQFAYAYISNYFDKDCNSNIRSQYLVATSADQQNFKGWASELYAGTPSMPSDAPSYVTQQDWSFVQLVLASEFENVPDAVLLINNMMDYAQNTYANQTKNDLQHCVTNVGEGTVTNTLNYWPQQFLLMAVWGAAALPFGPEYNVLVGMFASIFGSVLSRPTSPVSINFANLDDAVSALKTSLQDTYNTEIENYTADLNDIVNDETKLPLVGYLAENAWSWTVGEEYMLSDSTQISDRISFYQQLIPAAFNLLVWYNCTSNVPCTYDAKYQNPWRPVSNDHNYSWWAQPVYAQNVDAQTWNVYLLCQNQPSDLDGSNPLIYPSYEMISDLFSTLGVNKQEFFTAQKGWCSIKLCDSGYPDEPSSNKC